jgi:F0F1-type ATP synthase membrane subunit a
MGQVLGFFRLVGRGQFGPYTPENAIPWYTIMFVIACILTVLIITLLKGKLSEDDPGQGQLTLEAGFLAIKDLVVSVIGNHGFQYFPVVATFAVLILVSNLMGSSRCPAADRVGKRDVRPRPDIIYLITTTLVFTRTGCSSIWPTLPGQNCP